METDPNPDHNPDLKKTFISSVKLTLPNPNPHLIRESNNIPVYLAKTWAQEGVTSHVIVQQTLAHLWVLRISGRIDGAGFVPGVYLGGRPQRHLAPDEISSLPGEWHQLMVHQHGSMGARGWHVKSRLLLREYRVRITDFSLCDVHPVLSLARESKAGWVLFLPQ